MITNVYFVDNFLQNDLILSKICVTHTHTHTHTHTFLYIICSARVMYIFFERGKKSLTSLSRNAADLSRRLIYYPFSIINHLININLKKITNEKNLCF